MHCLTGRLLSLPGLVLLAGLAVGLGGCSDEPQTAAQAPAPARLDLDDAIVPEVVFEGEAATISAWGRDDAASFQRLEAEVLSWPGTEPGQIEVRAVGTPGANPDGSRFQSQISLPPLRVGDYELRLEGRDDVHTLSVLSAQGWVRYRSFHDPVRPDATLSIRADGTAVAHRDGRGRAVRTQLDERELAAIAEWFELAAFFSLEERYLSDHPMRVRRIDIGLQGDGGVHHVSAQEDLMPEALTELVARLDRLIETVLATETDRVPVVARLEIDPVEGEPGSGRGLHLTLVNVSDRAVTLQFRTSQLYDILVIRPPRSPNDADPTDPGDPPDPEDDGTDGPEFLLWNWAHDRDFLQVLTGLTLQPGASRTFTERWPGLDNRGNTVPAGIYHVRATIPSDLPIRPAAARLLVRGRVPELMPLVGTLSVVPATAAPGTERTIQLAVTNLNESDITVRFPTSQRFDLALVNRRGMGPDDSDSPGEPGGRGLVWQWSAGQVFVPTEEVVTWSAGATLVFDSRWSGTDLDGQATPTGVYELKGWITGRPGAAIRDVTVVVAR